MDTKNSTLQKIVAFAKHQPVLSVMTFAFTAGLLVAIGLAASPKASLEPEVASLTDIKQVVDAAASSGSYIQFSSAPTGDGGDTGSGSGTVTDLPDPISPNGRTFTQIIKDEALNGGVIVLPDGEYKVQDLQNYNPSNYLVVISQNKHGARVVRTSSTVGETDQYVKDSSKMIFIGVYFQDIQLSVSGSTDIFFYHTKHSFPILSHPDPYTTYCGGRRGPETIVVGGTSRWGLYGALIDGVGHDAIKLNNADNGVIRGVKATKIDHGGLQNGNGNSNCGWSGNDNYHDDGIQIFPGGVDNLLVENSYIGRQGMMQVDYNGASNTNLVFRDNILNQEDGSGNTACLVMDARVKSQAQSGARQTMTFQNNEAWCDNTSSWLFYVGGSRDGALVINGNPVSSSTSQVNQYITRRVGQPNLNSTPHEAWISANPYDNWACYLEQEVSGFSQSIKQC